MQDVDSEECVFEEIIVRDFFSVFKSYPYSNERWMVGMSKDGLSHCVTCLGPLEKHQELHSLAQVVPSSPKNVWYSFEFVIFYDLWKCIHRIHRYCSTAHFPATDGKISCFSLRWNQRASYYSCHLVTDSERRIPNFPARSRDWLIAMAILLEAGMVIASFACNSTEAKQTQFTKNVNYRRKLLQESILGINIYKAKYTTRAETV